MQQLNCTKGQVSTISVTQDLEFSSNILVHRFNESWIFNTGLSPVSTNYETFYFTVSPKYVTYVRKDLDLRPTIILSFSNSILSLQIHTHLGSIELVNVYASKPDTSIQWATTHSHFGKCIIMGDFNIHSTRWYSPAVEEAYNMI